MRRSASTCDTVYFPILQSNMVSIGVEVNTQFFIFLHSAKEIIESKQASIENESAKLTPEEVEVAYTAVGYGAVKYNDLKGNRGRYVHSKVF